MRIYCVKKPLTCVRNSVVILIISMAILTASYGAVQRSILPSLSIVEVPKSVVTGQTFAVKVRAVSAVGIEYIGFQYEGRTLRLKGHGKKEVTLTAKFKATKPGRQYLRVLAVGRNKIQSKTLTRTIHVIAKIKEKKSYTIKPVKPIVFDPEKKKIDPASLIVVSSLSIHPKPIFANQPSTATVTLNNPAPKGGLDVRVEVTYPDGRRASGFGWPLTLKVPARQREATFQLRTTKELPRRAHVSVILYGRRITEEVDVVWPPKISKLTIDPVQVHAGETARATVHLWDPALAGGTEVVLGTDPPETVGLPQQIVIPEGEKTGSFDFTIAREAPERITIKTSTSILSSKELQMPVNPPVILSSLRVEPQPVIVGQETNALLRLKEPASESGLNVKVKFTRKYGSPVSVFGPGFDITIPAGETQQTFPLKAIDDLRENVVVSVIQGGYSVSEEVKIVWPPAIESFVIDPSPAVKGETARATVTLRSPALFGGTAVKLVPREAEAMTIPDEISIPEGQKTGNFEIQISRDAPGTISIEAQVSSKSKMWASVSLNPPMFISSVSVEGERILIDEVARATVRLKEPAPEGGLFLTPEIRDLQGGRHNFFATTSRVSVPAGDMTASFSFIVREDRKYEALCGTKVYVTVNQGGHEVLEEVEIVCPPAVEAISIEPTPPLKGETAKATITLSETAHFGGTKVTLALVESARLSMPFEVTIPEGQKTGSFDISIFPNADDYFSIKARTSSVRSKTQTFQAIPPLVVSSISVEPLPIIVGESSRGTAIFKGPVTENEFEFEVFIKTPDGGSAWGFDGPRFSVAAPAGIAQTTFPLRTTKEYPDGVVVHILYKGISIAEKNVEVVAQQEIESLFVEPPRALAGRSVNVWITLNRPALFGETTVVKLSVSGPAADAVEIAESTIVPINQTQKNFIVTVDSTAEGFFVITAEILTHSLSIVVQIDQIDK